MQSYQRNATANTFVMEIERKYVVSCDFEKFVPDKKFSIQQTYFVCPDSLDIRLRRKTEIVNNFPRSVQFYETRKQGNGLSRIEQEIVLNEKEFDRLYKLYSGICIKKLPLIKTRFVKDRWEIDLFRFPDKGNAKSKSVNIAEIELCSENETVPNIPFGISTIKEITGDLRYYNRYIAEFGYPG